MEGSLQKAPIVPWNRLTIVKMHATRFRKLEQAVSLGIVPTIKNNLFKMESQFPKIEDLIPHAGRMSLLDNVISNNEEGTECSLTIREDSIFYDGSGSVPVWVGIEYMAQGVGAHAGLDALSRNETIRVGYFIGSRKVEFFTEKFTLGQRLKIIGQLVWEGDNTTSFDCSIEDEKDATTLMKARLNFFRPPSEEALDQSDER